MGTQLQAQKNSSPATPSSLGLLPSRILQRKCACGGTPGVGGECEQCQENFLQRKAASNLAIGQPGDAMEREADRVADAVVSGAGVTLDSPGSGAILQRQPAEQAQDKALFAVPPVVNEVLNSSGRPLDAVTRNFFSSRLGHDFSHVRVHTDARAVESARAVNALAYTVGQDVVFGCGQFRPDTHSGKQLLAHELVHVLEQGGKADRSAAATAAPGRLPSANAGMSWLSDGNQIGRAHV